ncbi:MAG: hypothetical protein IJR28_04105 [Ottowia sp.]|nr:hypothetical protein [Ottowia sp.]
MTATALNLETAISPEQRASGQETLSKPARPSWTSLLDETEPHPDFMPDRTPIGDAARFLKGLNTAAD